MQLRLFVELTTGKRIESDSVFCSQKELDDLSDVIGEVRKLDKFHITVRGNTIYFNTDHVISVEFLVEKEA